MKGQGCSFSSGRVPCCSRFASRKCFWAAVAVFLLVSHDAFKSYPMVRAQKGEGAQASFGRPAKATQYRWFTRIEWIATGKMRCSAAFIGTHFVLTAKHCIQENEVVSDFQAVVGFRCEEEDNCGYTEEVIPIEERTPLDNGGDVVILKLKWQATSEIPVAVPLMRSLIKKQKDVKRNRKLTLVGAGRTGEEELEKFGDGDVDVMTIQAKAITRKKCLKKISNKKLRASIEEFELICSLPTGLGTTCEGDSGAALVTKGKKKWKGRDIISAIHLAGPLNCADLPKQTPIVHYQMSKIENFVLGTVCYDEFPPDWCEGLKMTSSPSATTLFDVTSSPTIRPSKAPVQRTRRRPTREPTQEPTRSPLRASRDGGRATEPDPIERPTSEPSNEPTIEPTEEPSKDPSLSPTPEPTHDPTHKPTQDPTRKPTQEPTHEPTLDPSKRPVEEPTREPSPNPSPKPTREPSNEPTTDPTREPTADPTNKPTPFPTKNPTPFPTKNPTRHPTWQPTKKPTETPTKRPTLFPTQKPTFKPTSSPTRIPTFGPTRRPTFNPTKRPTFHPTMPPTHKPTLVPTKNPTRKPTLSPTAGGPATLLHVLEGHTDNVWSLDFHPNGSKLVSTSCDNHFMIWDVSSGARLNAQYAHDGCVRAVRYSPDGTRFMTGSNDNRVKLWFSPSDASQTSFLQLFFDDDGGWAGGVETVAWRKDSQKVVSAYGDATIRVHHVNAGSGTTTLAQAHTDRVFAADYDNDGSHIATGSSQALRLFDNQIFETKVFTAPNLFYPAEQTISYLEYSPDGAYLAISQFDTGSILIWNIGQSTIEKTLGGHATTVREVRWSPDGQYLISASRDNTARVWNRATGASVVILENSEWLQSVAWSRDGSNRVAVGSNDDKIYILEIKSFP